MYFPSTITAAPTQAASATAPTCTRTMLAIVVLAVAGCQQKMAAQPGYRPLEPSDFFNDGRSARPLVAGTIARGHLRNNRAVLTGRTRDPAVESPPPAGKTQPTLPAGSKAEFAPAEPPGFADESGFVSEYPIPLSQALIEHGRNRFMIYCVVCHDALGTGRGKIIERGYTAPPSYHIDRLRNAPVGRLFAVVSEGYGSMPSYADQIPFEDRWAIVAYVRALQLSQHFPIDELTPEERRQIDQAPPGDAVDLTSPQEGRK